MRALVMTDDALIIDKPVVTEEGFIAEEVVGAKKASLMFKLLEPLMSQKPRKKRIRTSNHRKPTGVEFYARYILNQFKEEKWL